VATSPKSKSQDLLVSVAESIGSTLGAIAAKADAAKDAIVGGTETAVKEAKRETTKLVRKGKRTVSRTRQPKATRKGRGSATKRRGVARKAKRATSSKRPRRHARR
jgi:hypothetical protein